MSKRIIVWGDLQAHPWQAVDTPDRWKECVSVVDQIYTYAENVSADMVVFLGDLFESKKMWRSSLVAKLIATIGLYHRVDGPEFIFLTGNHDLYDGHCLLECLKPFGEVIQKEPMEIALPDDDIPMLFVPYGADVSGLRARRYRLTFTHADVKGGWMGQIQTNEDQLPASFFTSSKLGCRVNHCAVINKRGEAGPAARCKFSNSIVLNGHYHTHQVIANNAERVPIVCVGAPMFHSWRDMGEELKAPRGFLDVTLGNDRSVDYKLIALPGPRFKRADDPDIRPGDFVQPAALGVQLEKDGVVTKAQQAIVSTDIKSAMKAYLPVAGVPAKECNSYLDAGYSLLEDDANA